MNHVLGHPFVPDDQWPTCGLGHSSYSCSIESMEGDVQLMVNCWFGARWFGLIPDSWCFFVKRIVT